MADTTQTKERVIYLNGEIVPDSQAKISVHDRGFKYGDAVFDTARTFRGQVFKLKEHIDRLYRSCQYMRLDPGMTKERMKALTSQVLDANRPLLGPDDDYWVTQRVSRGVDGASEATVVIECSPLPFESRAKYYRDGIPVVTPTVRRTPPQSQSPKAKTQNYINLILGDMEAKAANPDAWAVLLDINGNLAEGTGSNIFVVKDGALMTPQDMYVLGGVSRETVVELAQELGMDVLKTDIDLYDAYTADEVFLTSTSLCVCPVSSINGSRVGSEDVPGPVTARLLDAFSGLVGLDIAGQYLRRLEG